MLNVDDSHEDSDTIIKKCTELLNLCVLDGTFMNEVWYGASKYINMKAESSKYEKLKTLLNQELLNYIINEIPKMDNCLTSIPEKFRIKVEGWALDTKKKTREVKTAGNK